MQCNGEAFEFLGCEGPQPSSSITAFQVRNGHEPLNPNSEIVTTDSTDFTDFEQVIGVTGRNAFRAKASGCH
jgi:hypothetical protein